MSVERDWQVGPDRTNDPEIRRSLIGKVVVAGAKRATKGRSFEFMRVLAINPRLHLPYLLWNSRLMPRGKLPRSQTEAVIIRTAWLCGSEYEWTQHHAIGRGVGLSREQADAAGPEPASDLFDGRTRLLLGGVDELIEQHRLSDATYEALRAELPPKLILEYIMLVGTYAALAGSLNTFGVPLEDAWHKR
ncbi:MAG: carboxymuconolactone decarboxylase family protein [Solirubrobacterales bacterium]